MRLPWLLAERLLRRRGTALLRTSAFAALAAVVLGVASLVVVLALMTGYGDGLKRGILSGGGHLVALFPAGLPAREAERDTARIDALRGVERSAEVAYLPALLLSASGGGAEIVTLKATTLVPPFARGLAGNDGELRLSLGDGLAARLAVRPGDRLSVQIVASSRTPVSLPVRVADVYHTGFAELDERWAVTLLGDLRRRAAGVGPNGLEVWLADPDRAEAMRDAVDVACARRALVTTWQENNRNLFAALRWQKISLAIVLSLVLGVGAFEVASSLVVLVTEKRREIGVLLALGGRPALVRRTLLIAGGVLGGTGVLAGLLLGAVLVAVLAALGVPHFPPDIAAIYMVDHIPLRLKPLDVATVAVLGLVEVVLAALIPAHRAASRDPVEVLRWV